MIWKNQEPDDHFWAFYYYCKNRGDTVKINTNANENKDLIVMAKGKNSKSTYRTNEPNKRLAQYKKDIEKGLNRYQGDKQKFVSNFAQYILAEVRNERQMMQELIDKLEETYMEFEPKSE